MLIWKKLKSEGEHLIGDTYRAKVPGGWLILTKYFDSGGLTFYPDPTHSWSGNSLL